MSRLWLDRRALGIFSERTWLHTGKRLMEVAHDAGNDAEAMESADALLRQCESSRWLRPRLDVTLGGGAARVIVLPWQDGLRTTSQQMRYAEACLEDAGVNPSGGWGIQYGYRRHGRDGIAYALKNTQLERLKALASAHRLRLRGVLPLAAAAYWRAPLDRRGGMLSILGEGGRITLLRFVGAALVSVDVQPCGDQPELALRRLLRRAQASDAPIETIGCWSTAQASETATVVAEYYPQASIRTLSRRDWE